MRVRKARRKAKKVSGGLKVRETEQDEEDSCREQKPENRKL